MKYFLYFLLVGLACVVVFLTFDLEANLLKVSIISAITSIICLFIFNLVRKPLKKWFRRNFDKTYMMNRGYIKGKKAR